MTLATPELEELTLSEIAIPCEAQWVDLDGKDHKCEQDAQWVVRTTCHCDHIEIDLLCREHYEAMSRIAASGPLAALFTFMHFICTECGCHNGAVDVHAEPL